MQAEGDVGCLPFAGDKNASTLIECVEPAREGPVGDATGLIDVLANRNPAGKRARLAQLTA
jgi:hypothetical protein